MVFQRHARESRALEHPLGMLPVDSLLRRDISLLCRVVNLRQLVLGIKVRRRAVGFESIAGLKIDHPRPVVDV